MACGSFISDALGRQTASRAGRALDLKWRREREKQKRETEETLRKEREREEGERQAEA